MPNLIYCAAMTTVLILVAIVMASALTQFASILDPLASVVLLALAGSWIGKKLWKSYVSNPWHHY